ncbi:MAG TPA: ABC transporter substrate-binding protein [Streptosporangiaceae bacterium]|nr:ABC transporter substrate-binding protein [Streptosporangiaceae bacterium]
MGVKHLRIHTALAALCVLALAACGSSGSGSGGSSTNSGSSANAGASFGTLGEVCGPGSATGATATGVQDKSIEVSVIADINVPGAPGLLQPMWDSATAFVDWCNAAGGILGRKLILDKRDSAETDYLPQVEASCTADFAMVGTMGVLDNTGVAAWEKCGIPNFTASTVSEAAANAKLMYPVNPLPADQENIGGFPVIFKQYPGVQDHIGTLYAEGAAGAREQHTYNEAIEADGGKVVYTAEYNALGSVNWAPYVEAMKKAGVTMLFLNDTIPTSVALDQAMSTAGWYPTLQISPPQDYDTSFLTTGASVAKNYYVYMPSEPLEAASAIPAVAQYEEIAHKYVPTAHLGFFGEMAFSSWLLFTVAAKACGSHLTRTCLEQEVAKQTNWTGGGLQGTINPASNRASQCFIVMKIENAKFVQAIPAKLGQFYCNPANVPVVKP